MDLQKGMRVFTTELSACKWAAKRVGYTRSKFGHSMNLCWSVQIFKYYLEENWKPSFGVTEDNQSHIPPMLHLVLKGKDLKPSIYRTSWEGEQSLKKMQDSSSRELRKRYKASSAPLHYSRGSKIDPALIRKVGNRTLEKKQSKSL